MAEQQAQITDPADAVAAGLVRLILAMEALYNRQSRKAGLTAQQAQLLCTAARRTAGLGEIAEALHCDRSNVSRLLDRVTRRGLAYRAPDSRDGRVSVLQLSPDGQAVVTSFEAGLAARLGHLIADWPAGKRQAAADALAALIDAIQRDLAGEDQAAGGTADDTATAAAAPVTCPDDAGSKDSIGTSAACRREVTHPRRPRPDGRPPAERPEADRRRR
jgi:DNA-binding MarR family transcriptional regulator